MKAIAIVTLIAALSTSLSHAAPPKLIAADIEGGAALAVQAYRGGGMGGLVGQSKDCWKNVSPKSYLCLYIDLAARYIDQSMSSRQNFPLHPYFEDQQFGERAGGIYNYNNVDMQEANKHLMSAQTKINAAVNKAIR